MTLEDTILTTMSECEIVVFTELRHERSECLTQYLKNSGVSRGSGPLRYLNIKMLIGPQQWAKRNCCVGIINFIIKKIKNNNFKNQKSKIKK